MDSYCNTKWHVYWGIKAFSATQVWIVEVMEILVLLGYGMEVLSLPIKCLMVRRIYELSKETVLLIFGLLVLLHTERIIC